MNYYPRFPGHYVAKTLHLSMEKDGAYTRLLDWVYLNEKPVPHDARFAITRAMTASERRAVDAVLAEFFVLENGGWTNDRAVDEIAAAQPKIAAARANGQRGGRPRKTHRVSDQEPTGFLTETHGEPTAKAPQSPIPNQEQEQERSSTLTNDEGPKGRDPAAAVTLAGRTCLLLREAGFGATNPSHPALIAALAAGVTPEAIRDTAVEAAELGKQYPAIYAYTTALRRHNDQPQAPGGFNGTRSPRRRVGLADKHPRPTPRDDDAIPGTAVRIDP